MPPTGGNVQQLAGQRPPTSQRDMEAIRSYLASQGAMGDFNRGTRESYLTQPSIAFTQGQPNKVDMPQTGFLADVVGIVSGTTTTGAASSTTARSYIPTPLGIVRQFRVFNNQGVDIWNTSAWGSYLINKTQKVHLDWLVEQAGEFNYSNGFNNSQDPFTRYRNTDASLGASAVQNWKFPFWLPVAWGPSLQNGLQLLQDPAIRYSLQVGWGDATDLYSATTGTVTLSGITCLPTTHLFHVPERSIDLPKLSFSKTTIEDTQPLLSGSGDNVYKFVTGNMASKVLLEYVNAPGGVQTPFTPTGATPSASTNPITRIKLRYSQTQIPYDSDADTWLMMQRWRYSQDLPGGVYVHELSMPNGLPELVGIRDVINTARLTDLDLIATLAGQSLTNAFIRGIREQLVKNR